MRTACFHLCKFDVPVAVLVRNGVFLLSCKCEDQCLAGVGFSPNRNGLVPLEYSVAPDQFGQPDSRGGGDKLLITFAEFGVSLPSNPLEKHCGLLVQWSRIFRFRMIPRATKRIALGRLSGKHGIQHRSRQVCSFRTGMVDVTTVEFELRFRLLVPCFLPSVTNRHACQSSPPRNRTNPQLN